MKIKTSTQKPCQKISVYDISLRRNFCMLSLSDNKISAILRSFFPPADTLKNSYSELVSLSDRKK